LQGAEPGAGVVTLHGRVGKRQLAAEYVYRFGSEYDVVWWVNAEKLVSFTRRGSTSSLVREVLGPAAGIEMFRTFDSTWPSSTGRPSPSGQRTRLGEPPGIAHRIAALWDCCN
jgi:hypothetical protein